LHPLASIANSAATVLHITFIFYIEMNLLKRLFSIGTKKSKKKTNSNYP
jgi:hypothetical protein